MEGNHQRHGPNRREIIDPPVMRNEVTEWTNTSEHNHRKDHDEAENEGELESAQDGRYLVEE